MAPPAAVSRTRGSRATSSAAKERSKRTVEEEDSEIICALCVFLIIIGVIGFFCLILMSPLPNSAQDHTLDNVTTEKEEEAYLERKVEPPQRENHPRESYKEVGDEAERPSGRSPRRRRRPPPI